MRSWRRLAEDLSLKTGSRRVRHAPSHGPDVCASPEAFPTELASRPATPVNPSAALCGKPGQPSARPYSETLAKVRREPPPLLNSLPVGKWNLELRPLWLLPEIQSGPKRAPATW